MIPRFPFSSFPIHRQIIRNYFTLPVPNKLRDVVKMSLFERESRDTIQSLWHERFDGNDKVVSETLTKSEFAIVKANSKRSPVFVCPVTSPSGYWTCFSQFQDTKHVLFTPLEMYRSKGPHAPPLFILTFFEELSEEKGLVLVRGDIISNELKKNDAKRLYHNIKAFYSDAGMYRWVEQFNHRSRSFDFETFRNKFQFDFSKNV
eukprot:Selendium_serpulae@DN3645_c0_g1_i1.p2